MNMAAPVLALELMQRAPAAGDALAWRNALGALCYGDVPALPAALPCAHVAMPVLDGATASCELWRGASAPMAGRHGEVSFCADGALLFGCLALDESDGLCATTRAAYAALFETLDREGYPHLVRCWNYLANINGETEELERYRQFNIGRQQGFEDGARPLTAQVPAACALGTASGPLVVAFLAARSAPVQIENPRQVSAYDYPADYGPRSPTFARAALLPVQDGEVLFVSGTASIVGHRTLHAHDAASQTVETLANLRAVVDAANRASAIGGYTLGDLALKVYVRHPHDLAAIRHTIDTTPDAPRTAVYLQADICRKDLLVEIEAAAQRNT